MYNQPYVHILLIDDHPLVRDGLRSRLESVPRFTVVAEAGNAEEALRHAESNTIDLALMDVSLGGMNGIELTGRFNTLFPEIAILMLSMHDKAEYVMQAVQAGARGYVLKDAPAADIIAAIDTVMSGGIYYSAGLARQLAQPIPPATLLTPREKEVLHSIATGKSNKHIARELNLSVRTVETHRQNIKRKLGIEGQADLIRFALEQTIIK
ncbi:two component transcriptional regulator, LuxR family [Noviherbaspirillum humi]|uniref:Two component transcriptional regulator, LuxR family n=1 Tax=Noviherbaspirillum humi TaxID=1688639 RepID=A0A239DVB9_9BURK|nr:response regulator transcription factor [Noviherbaspirillum humi]SNS36267.1 two component transcriptional regulator, LuxR family [Noviherbaspirillum humi]